MGRPHYSIASLLVVIGVFGIALAALRNPSYLWANVTFTLALTAIVLAIINTIYGRGANRAYWLGFALCGGIYLATCSIPGIREAVCVRLATEVLFDLVYPHVAPEPPPPPPTPPAEPFISTQNGQLVLQPWPAAAPASRWSAWTEPDRTIGLGYPIGTVHLVSSEAFRQIGHALAALLVGVIGGTYARRRFDGAIRVAHANLDR